jgi:uncharacterized protein YggE
MQKAALIATVMGMLAAGSVIAEDSRTVTVSGHGEIEVEPDIATVEMGIFVFDADLLKAKQEADGKIAKLLATFKTLDVKPEDIRTTQLYVKPKYKEVDDKWQFVGYEITRSVTVTFRAMAKLNDLIDKSIEAGANRLEDINLSSSREREIKEETLMQAIENAKNQAARLADGFGAKAGKVVTIQKGGRDPFGGVMYSMSTPAFGAATFQPGRIKIDSDVHAVFELTD